MLNSTSPSRLWNGGKAAFGCVKSQARGPRELWMNRKICWASARLSRKVDMFVITTRLRRALEGVCVVDSGWLPALP